MISYINVHLTKNALNYAFSRKTDRSVVKGKPKYNLIYIDRNKAKHSIILSIDDLAEVAKMSIFPSRKLKENFFLMLSAITFPDERNVCYNWIYGFDSFVWRWNKIID